MPTITILGFDRIQFVIYTGCVTIVKRIKQQIQSRYPLIHWSNITLLKNGEVLGDYSIIFKSQTMYLIVRQFICNTHQSICSH